MEKLYIFILAIIMIFICTNIKKETFDVNKYSTILINHDNYHICIIKNKNNNNMKIYKIYKD